MRAATLVEYGRALEITDLPDPAAPSDGVVVRVDACGICGSDVHAWRGDWRWRMDLPLPHVLGHEVAGTVVEVGLDAQGFSEGDQVTLPFHLDCGRCVQCDEGRSNLCLNYSAIGFGPPVQARVRRREHREPHLRRAYALGADEVQRLVR